MLEIKNAVKQYDGGCEALCGLSLCVEEKGVYAILGDKGAGKTALARVICGCEDADSGEVLWNGEPMSRKNMALKKKVRLVPSELLLDKTVTANEYLDFVGETLDIAPDKKYRQIKEALELVCIEDVQDRLFSVLTPSQRCRLAIAASLLGNPDLLVLDDPFAAINNTDLDEFCQLMDMLGKIKTVLLLTHSTDEVRRMSEYVYILHEGRIVLGGKLSEILQKLNSTCQMNITVRGQADIISEAIRTVDTVVDVKVADTDMNGITAVSVEHMHDEMIKDKLFSALAAINAPMLSTSSVTLGLDDIFYSFRSSKRRTQPVGKGVKKAHKAGRRSE